MTPAVFLLSAEEMCSAGSYVEQLRLSVHEHLLPNSDRVRAAASCFGIAQVHHHAIIRLIEERLYASAFALVRAEFEAYVRGEWLSLCASDSEVKRFLLGKEPPKLDELLAKVEATDSFNEQVLSQIKRRSWKAMCGYTHTGGLHVQRWNTEDGVESNYSREEILEVMRFAETIASLTVIGVARLANDDELAMRTLEAFKTRVAA